MNAQTIEVPLDQLHLEAPGFENPRTKTSSGLDDESIRELAADIAARGLLYPLLVWEIDQDCYLIVGGQRRFLAMRHLGWAETEVKVLPGDTPEEAQIYAIADNVHRRQLSTYEIAKTLIAVGGTAAETSLKVGLSASYVTKLIAMYHEATPELREAWRDKKFKDNKIHEISKHQPEAQLEVLGIAPSEAKPLTPTRIPKGPPRRGPKVGSRAQPSIDALRVVAEKISPPGEDPYRIGVRDALRYAAFGEVSTDPRWSDYTSVKCRPNRAR